MNRLEALFIRSVVVVLLITAIAKIISASGDTPALELPHPMLALSYREVFVLGGAIECAVAGFLVFSRRSCLQLLVITWVAVSFVLYRIGLLLIGIKAPCGCLGNLTALLDIPPTSAELWMNAILSYLVLGSSVFLARRFSRTGVGAEDPSHRPTVVSTLKQSSAAVLGAK